MNFLGRIALLFLLVLPAFGQVRTVTVNTAGKVTSPTTFFGTNNFVAGTNITLSVGSWGIRISAGGSSTNGLATISYVNISSNGLATLMVTGDNAVSNGAIAFTMTASNSLEAEIVSGDLVVSNALVALLTARDTTTSNGVYSASTLFTLTASNSLDLLLTANMLSVSNDLAAFSVSLSNLLYSTMVSFDTTTSNALVTAYIAADAAVSNACVAFGMTVSNAVYTTTINGLTNKIDNQSGRGTNTTLINATNTTGAITAVPITVQGITGMVTNLFEVKDTNGNVQATIKSNGVLRLPNGSVSQVAVGGTNQDNTGLYFIASASTPEIDFAVNGTERAAFTSVGGSGLQLLNTYGISWNSVIGNTPGAAIYGPGSGVIHMARGGGASGWVDDAVTNRIYGFGRFNSVINPTNAHFLELGYDNTFNWYFLRSNTNQTGILNATNQPLAIGIGTNANILINTNGVGNVTFQSGSASFPAIGWTADDDGGGTGLFRSAANAVGISCNGFEFVRINSTGMHLGTVPLFGGNGLVNDDITLIRDISGVFDIYNANSATKAVTNRIFGTSTGTITVSGMTNAEWMEYGYDGAQSWFFLRAQKGSSNGTARPLALGANGTSADLQINTNHSVTVPNSLTNQSYVHMPSNTAPITVVAPANLHAVTIGKSGTNDLGARADIELSIKYADAATGDPAWYWTNSTSGRCFTNNVQFGLTATVTLQMVIPDVGPNEVYSFNDLSGVGASVTILSANWLLK